MAQLAALGALLVLGLAPNPSPGYDFYPPGVTSSAGAVRYPELDEVRLFGSRAIGCSTSRSDIDLATIGISDRRRLGQLMLDLDDLPIPQVCDVVDYARTSSPLLRRHINTVGVTVWRRHQP